jgi:hypothetical protein
MRLSFDLDGVLADLGPALRREAERLFPEVARTPANAPTPEAGSPGEAEPADDSLPTVRVPWLTSRQHRTLWKEVSRIDNFWETLDETEEGIVARLWSLARERRWEVLFVTSRPVSAGDTVQVQTQRWLARHGFELPSVMVVHGNRGAIAASLDLDVHVDDRPEHCLNVAIESRARAILVWKDRDATVPVNARRFKIGTVTSVGECLTMLAEADRSGRSVPGMLGRLLELLGLRPATEGAGTRR